MPLGKPFFFVMFAFFAVVGAFLVLATPTEGPEAVPAGFKVFWVGALVWNAYWFLFRIAVSLRLEDRELVWDAPLRSGRIAVGDVVAVRPMRFASNVEVFEQRGGRPVMVMVTKGLSDFLAELSKLNPNLPVRLGWQSRLAERLPGRSRLD